MISREDAKRIAEETLAKSRYAEQCGSVRAVYELDEIPFARPNCYPLGEDGLRGAWIAYGESTLWALQSSIVVVIDMTTGMVRYVGSAHDEG